MFEYIAMTVVTTIMGTIIGWLLNAIKTNTGRLYNLSRREHEERVQNRAMLGELLFTDSKIYTDVLSSKAIHVLRLINSRLTTFIIITMMNWGSTGRVHTCIMKSWMRIKTKE